MGRLPAGNEETPDPDRQTHATVQNEPDRETNRYTYYSKNPARYTEEQKEPEKQIMVQTQAEEL